MRELEVGCDAVCSLGDFWGQVIVMHRWWGPVVVGVGCVARWLFGWGGQLLVGLLSVSLCVHPCVEGQYKDRAESEFRFEEEVSGVMPARSVSVMAKSRHLKSMSFQSLTASLRRNSKYIIQYM